MASILDVLKLADSNIALWSGTFWWHTCNRSKKARSVKRANTGFSISRHHSCPSDNRWEFQAFAKNACIYFELSPGLPLNGDRCGLSNSPSRDVAVTATVFICQWRIQSDGLFTFRSLVSFESDSNIANSRNWTQYFLSTHVIACISTIEKTISCLQI